ncbi:MAG: UDP-N-acetylmuramoyl-L-alanine--D-glutamate ligase [Candidatus Lightella neohaematopini]|nr:UDP-N-acetylmuramoyl-L-alanine--D-glutamate ligase [Candidatus Lightella neohaematopini]MCV2528744.1 UDP-N-acetylmuramoyl-L-alanine--D-glutamate ligase [Candidatus Lightella neohaematopini]
MANYKNKNIVIIGLGITGLSCIKFFLKRGIIPKVIDTRKYLIKPIPNYIPCHLGSINKLWLFSAELIIISPGLKLKYSLLLKLISLNIKIISDIELFIREVNKPIIAITGSNGKSTVTTLVSKIIQSAGFIVGVGGNIGIPVLSLLDQYYQIYVIELSSFQLEFTYSLHAIIAVVTNISEDHMDYYPLKLIEYSSIKYKIYYNAKYCIINTKYYDKLLNYNNSYHITFGKSGNYKINYYNNSNWIIVNDNLVLSCNNLKIKGMHNYYNVLISLAIADILCIPRNISISIICAFSGLNHRFQVIHECNNIKWINDSKSTNVSSTKAALESIIIKNKLHLILGGDSKLANFSPLLPWLNNNNIIVYCFGKDRYKIASLCNTVVLANTLEQLMYIVASSVVQKDIVLLSPACASTDQFKSFIERGELFTKLAKTLY